MSARPQTPDLPRSAGSYAAVTQFLPQEGLGMNSGGRKVNVTQKGGSGEALKRKLAAKGLWLKKPVVTKMACPGKWKHGPKPA